jgi:hypothetical protein
MCKRALVFVINHEDEATRFIVTVLPTWFAIAAAAAAEAPFAPAAATATITTAVATAAAVAAAAESTAAATTAAILTRFGFVDFQSAATDFLAIHLLNGCSGFFRSGHFDEGKAARTARHSVFDHTC